MGPVARTGYPGCHHGLVAGLPFIDEHAVHVPATPERTWDALVAPTGSVLSGRPSELVATALGCRETRASAPPLREGSTVVGFRVARFEPPRVLGLEGEHRFARYALTFHVDAIGTEQSRVRAQTHADFPGRLGSVYRGLVIGSRGHVLGVRRMLRAIRARAT
jgi:hypothetical protein